MSQLKLLYLSNNYINILPESLGKLDLLTELRLGDNLLNTLPESIGNLTSLRRLDIGNNPIQRIPDSITSLRNLSSLFLKGINKDLSSLIKILKQKKVSITI